jgi:hypothetical protein
MFKSAYYFFNEEDEEEVSKSLLARFPGLKFVNGQRWASSEPPIVEGIHKCTSGIAYLWPSHLVPTLPCWELPPERRYCDIRLRLDIKYQGPTVGCVIQFLRCLQKDGQIEFGQANATIESKDDPVGRWQTQLINFLKKQYRWGVDCIKTETGELLNGNERGFLVGPFLRAKDPKLPPRLTFGIGRDTHAVPVSPK